MADVYFIDGQALQPTAFGSRNTEGVWIPREGIDFNDVWGNNGFHLDFADPNDLGADRSPNGNNWTQNGAFNTDPVGIFSSMLFTDDSFTADTVPDLTTARILVMLVLQKWYLMVMLLVVLLPLAVGQHWFGVQPVITDVRPTIDIGGNMLAGSVLDLMGILNLHRSSGNHDL